MKKQVLNIIEDFKKEEDAFVNTRFLAPVLRGGQVRVKISGIVLELRVVDSKFQGWAILSPLDFDRAKIVSSPSLSQIHDYLKLFPQTRLILCDRFEQWRGIIASKGDGRFKLDGLVPVNLVEGGQLFEHVIAAYDGTTFWYVRAANRDPWVAKQLRSSLKKMWKPEELKIQTLTPEEREAYALLYEQEMERRIPPAQKTLMEALKHAEGELETWIERGDTYTVTYHVDGQKYTSTVKRDLTVVSAGICLSGEDEKFDLQSLVGVLRERERNGWN